MGAVITGIHTQTQAQDFYLMNDKPQNAQMTVREHISECFSPKKKTVYSDNSAFLG